MRYKAPKKIKRDYRDYIFYKYVKTGEKAYEIYRYGDWQGERKIKEITLEKGEVVFAKIKLANNKE